MSGCVRDEGFRGNVVVAFLAVSYTEMLQGARRGDVADVRYDGLETCGNLVNVR